MILFILTYRVARTDEKWYWVAESIGSLKETKTHWEKAGWNRSQKLKAYFFDNVEHIPSWCFNIVSEDNLKIFNEN